MRPLRTVATVIVTALLTVAPAALAQGIGDPARAFADAAGIPEGADSAVIAGTEVRIDTVSDLLLSVTIEGRMDEQGIATSADLLALATGFGASIRDPIRDFLTANLEALAREGETGVRVETYLLTIDAEAAAEGVHARLTLTLPRLEADAFGPAVATKGPSDAPLVIREFSDFQCPFCKQYAEQVLQGGLMETLLQSGEVRFAFHHFPLSSIHANAEPAAEAAQCVANRFGDEAFWAYHDLLFERQSAWSGLGDPDAYLARLIRDIDPALLAHAAAADADGGEIAETARAEVSRCLTDGDGRAAVVAGRELALSLGLSGTPTVFVDGFRLSAFQSPEGYARLIRLATALREEEVD